MSFPYPELRRLAEAQGWTVTLTRNNHFWWISPDGARVLSSSTTGDQKSTTDLRSRLRRAGLRIPHHGASKPKRRPSRPARSAV